MASPRLTQFSQGCDLLHLSLKTLASAPLLLEIRTCLGRRIISIWNWRTHFLFRQGAHDNGTLFLFLTTRYCPSGENWPLLVVDVEGGVGVILGVFESCGDWWNVCWSFCAEGTGGGTQANPKFISPSAWATVDVFNIPLAQMLLSSAFQVSANTVAKCGFLRGQNDRQLNKYYFILLTGAYYALIVCLVVKMIWSIKAKRAGVESQSAKAELVLKLWLLNV